MAAPAIIQNFIDGPKLPKVVLGVALLVAIVAGGYYLLISPVDARIAQLRTKNAALQTELAQSRAAVAELDTFRRELEQLQKRLAALKEKLPQERETPGLYKALSESAQKTGLGVSLFQPREAKPRDYVNELPITLQAEGGYHQVAQFFELVARLPRVVNVTEIKLTGQRGARTVKADLMLATYTYRAAAA
ncbi:MAG: type 4a pilus biogenesis protein PilO, partial [Candidatus Rokuibacteriota bacterium]